MSTDGLYIGLMSGTSLDAVDCILAQIDARGTRLLASHSETLDPALRDELSALCQPGDNEIDRLGDADQALAETCARGVAALLATSAPDAGEVIAIGSHGQTVRHRPSSERPFTVQIGDPNRIAQLTGITVVADFRRRDMAAGGQGAPLAPAFHAAAFASSADCRAIVNIGGMANITILQTDQTSLGFDTGPGNVLMDAWIFRELGLRFDAQGAWGARGQVSSQLLQALHAHPFLALPPPKSTGREDFSLGWLEQVLAAQPAAISALDVQASLLEFTASTIGAAVLAQTPTVEEVFLCGGGAHNSTLVCRLEALLPSCTVSSTAALGIEPDWVEATAFAWLAYRTLGNLPGNLPAVTGASMPVILGGIYPASCSVSDRK